MPCDRDRFRMRFRKDDECNYYTYILNLLEGTINMQVIEIGFGKPNINTVSILSYLLDIAQPLTEILE